MSAVDAFEQADPTACDECGREGCEEHIPSVQPSQAPQSTEHLIGRSLDELLAHRFPPRRSLLMRGDAPILRAGQLAQVFAERGIGKTWLLQTLALVAASASSALGFQAPAPCRVLHVDGEMFGEDLQERFHRLVEQLHIPGPLPLTIVAADWQDNFLRRLDTQTGQDALEPFIEQADLVILDNRSCLFDPEGEKDPTAWQPAQDWLLSLRRRGKSVLFAHHGNRQGGARGHSKAEDPLDVVIKLARPDDYAADQGARFLVTFDKTRGIHGAAVAPFVARLTPEGWHTENDSTPDTAARLAEYVRLAQQAGDPVKSATAAIRGIGINKQLGLKAWAELLHTGVVCRHPEGGFRAA